MMIEHDRIDFDIPVLPEDNSAICDTVAKICADHPAEYWRALEKKPAGERFPKDFMAAMTKAGMTGATIPEEHGGADLTIEAVAAIVETVHASGANAAAMIAQYHAVERLLEAGAQNRAAEVLEAVAEGAASLYANAMLKGSAEADSEQGVTLSGTADRVTGACASDWILVDLPESDAFVLAARDKIEATPVRELTNSDAWDLDFDKVRVPAGEVFRSTNSRKTRAANVRLVLDAAAAVGDGRFFSHRGTQYANERIVFGSPIGSYQGIQFPLARAHIEVEAANIALRRAIARIDAGFEGTSESLVAHHLAVEAAWNMADAAFTTYGGFAFAREYDIERKWRDVRAARLSALPEADDLARIGAEALGLVAE